MRTLVVLAAATLALAGCSATVELTTNDVVPASATASPPTATAPAPASSTPPSPTPAPGDERPVVAPVGSYVLGDSISLGVGPRLSRLGYPVTGRVGQSASDAYLSTYLRTTDARQAPAWVIVLGTNNAGGEADVAAVDGWLDLLDDLRQEAQGQDVYWVTPYRDPRYSGSLSSASLDAFVAELVRQGAVRPWLHVIDFASAAAEHPEWFDDDGAHLHPDDAGNAVLAAMIAGPDAVPLLAPAPLQTLDGPGGTPTSPTSSPSASSAEPSSEPSSTRTANAEPPTSAVPSAGPSAAERTPADAQPSLEAPAAEFGPAG